MVLVVLFILAAVDTIVIVSVSVLIFAAKRVGVELVVIVSVNVLTIPLALATVETMVMVSINDLTLVVSLPGVEDIEMVSVTVLVFAANRFNEAVAIVTVSVKDLLIALAPRNLVTASVIEIV